MSLGKSPSSSFTGDSSGAEPGGPGLFCQGANWLPVPVLPVCGMDMQGFAAIHPPAVLTTPFHPLHLLPMLLALQVLFLIPAHSSEVLKHPTSLSLTADTWDAVPQHRDS